MRFVYSVTFMLLSFAAFSGAPEDTCSGEFQAVIHKGDTIVVNCDRMVLMNAETFAHYYHDSKALEELREDVPEWAATIDSIKAAHEANRLELEEIASIREQQVELERESKEELIEDLIEAEQTNKRLRRKNKRLRIFGAGSSGLSLLLLLILL